MLKKLYDNDYHRLRRLAFSMAGNECEDLVQDSFIKMIPYQHLSYSEAQALITTILKNKCRDWLRRQKYINRQMESMPEPASSCEIARSIDARELKEQINRLPKYTRKVINMRYYDDMNLRDIGKWVGKNHATVYSQIQRGLQKLKPLQTI